VIVQRLILPVEDFLVDVVRFFRVQVPHFVVQPHLGKDDQPLPLYVDVAALGRYLSSKVVAQVLQLPVPLLLR